MNRQIRGMLTVALCVFALGCADNPERHFNLGNWYYQKGLVDDAHYNLAIAYSKKGWYDYALKEAETTFDMWPTKENYEMVELLKKRRGLERLDIETEA